MPCLGADTTASRIPPTTWSVGIQLRMMELPHAPCGCACPCHPFGASWEPRTAGGGGKRVAGRPPSCFLCVVPETVRMFRLSRFPDPDSTAAQVGDRAPSEQDPAPRQAPRALRVPGARRAVVGRHAGAAPRVPQGADADRQDPGPHGQCALCVHRAQEEVGPEPGCRARPWRGRGEVSASDFRLGGCHPAWRSPVVKAAFIPPQWPRSTSLGFVSPGIQTSEKVAPSFSEGSRAPSPCFSSSTLTPSISTSRAWSPVRPDAQPLSESRSLGLPGPCSLMQRHFL